MKKFTPTLLGLLVASAAFGQEQVNTLPAQMEVANPETQVNITPRTDYRGSEAILWSEDFANGIPATWSNQGFDGNLSPLAAAQWEYRGTSTTPTNAEGSRGAFSGVNNNPPTNDPVASTTTANGFVIFDSDYLDNSGNSANIGGGTAPAPHVGTLTTSTIDLTGEPYVMLEMESYARVFFANMQVAFSTDGGTTWGDTATIYTDASLGVNGSSANADLVQVNVSNIIGNQSNVKMRFIFDGRPGNANGNGYYFWMIDDIRLSDLPRHSIRFVENTDGAPERDIIYGTTTGESKTGIMTLKQTRPIAFDCNVLNFGWDQQDNVQLELQVLSNGNVVQTLNSGTVNVASGGIADYTVLNTSTWTPSAEGAYDIVWIAKSDSCNGTVAPFASDTSTIYVTDSLLSLDFNVFENRFGTGNIGDDGSAVATRMDLVQDERLFAADIWLSATTVPGGVIEVTVYDTTGFDFTNGFPTQPLAYYQHTVTQTDVDNGAIRADLTGTDGFPVYLSTANTGSYYIVVTFFSNAGANPIFLRNDQSFPQPALSSIMYYTISSPRWYTGFTNSLSINGLHIRAITCPAASAAACMEVGIEEVDLSNVIDVYPNPAEDVVFLEFGDDFNGDIEINVVDLQGRTVISTSEVAIEGTKVPVSLNTLTPGVYMMNIAQGDAMSTFKLTVK
ncbi:T9SS type A sorting domain-containing protein [Phaeocystidibacter luteus]|uniref:T9SS type A sorting domain-containing protein n=1 Tax=Phaeocystidibacter luteus TaxID=911197 RepID=A0A6N6RGK1_9FLAO|nr:T9SS type A sorting domain-containing protein [Phaeocystidibacter luteus]KAB2810309.1 T9SS type A sorting domain-containing protein [Phaeocystidibacter luteus]